MFHFKKTNHYSCPSTGKDTGLVSNVRVTHATPAAAYAHVAYRWWESDGNQAIDEDHPLTEEERKMCPDIAKQLIEDEYAQQIKVNCFYCVT